MHRETWGSRSDDAETADLNVICFQRRQCCSNRRLEVTQSAHIFFSSFKLQYEIKGGTSTFPPQILSLRGFFFSFSQAPLMTSEHDKWSWCDGMCGRPKWLWGSELPKPTQHTRHSNLRLRRWRERGEKKAVKLSHFRPGMRIYIAFICLF